MADNARSIPSLVDGLKPGQRKILFSCFKRKLKKEIKVAQLAGYISEHSAYHHGEASLTQTIVGMAQNYVGSNNLNLLYPGGQFGTRHMGGKDSASARYIFTRLCDVTRKLFHPDDDVLLTYLDDDGKSIEPLWYIPIVPTVLINGADGIGTGWATYVPDYDPREVISNIKRMMNGEELLPLTPKYCGWKGVMTPNEKGFAQDVSLCIEEIDEDSISISELPVRCWTHNYKIQLEKLQEAGLIDQVSYHHTDTTVSITIVFNAAFKYRGINAELMKRLKLSGSISTSNMVLFDKDGKLRRYKDPNDILREFYYLRCEYYTLRKKALLKALNADLQRLQWKAKFILMVCKKKLELRNKKRKKLCDELENHCFPRLFSARVRSKVYRNDEEDSEQARDKSDESKGYEYLLNMPIRSLTYEQVEKLKAERDAKKKERDALQQTSPVSIWERDIDNLLKEIERREKQMSKDAARDKEQVARGRKRQKKTPKRRKTKKQKRKETLSKYSATPKAKKRRVVKTIPSGSESSSDDDSYLPLSERIKAISSRSTSKANSGASSGVTTPKKSPKTPHPAKRSSPKKRRVTKKRRAAKGKKGKKGRKFNSKEPLCMCCMNPVSFCIKRVNSKLSTRMDKDKGDRIKRAKKITKIFKGSPATPSGDLSKSLW